MSRDSPKFSFKEEVKGDYQFDLVGKLQSRGPGLSERIHLSSRNDFEIQIEAIDVQAQRA